MVYLILSLVIAALSGGGFLWVRKLIKDKKSLQFKLDFADNQIEDLQTNKNNYLKIIQKLSKKVLDNESFGKQVENTSGSKLAALANSL